MHVWKRSVFVCVHCLCYEIDIYTDISEDQISEEIDQDLNEEEDIRMDEIRD